MAKKIKKFMAMVLALCICFSALPLQALAAEDGTVVKGPETTVTDGVKTEVTTTTKTETNPETGEKTVTVTIQSEAGGTKESNGEKVEGSETKTTTTVTETDGDKTVTKVTDGYEKTENIVPDSVKDVTVEVPTTTDDPATAENEGQNTATTPTEAPAVSGNEPSGEEDKNYNYTETTEIPGSVTITTTDITVTEQVDSENTDLDYVHTDATPDKDNDLFTYGSGVTVPEEVEVKDGFEFVHLGCENDSQFYASYLYKTPGYEGEEPILELNGVKYYSRREGLTSAINKNYSVDGVYQNGEKVYDERVNTIWDQITNFLMVDAETGELITTYCADKNTGAVKGFSYNIENIEDAGYYTEEQAKMIRTVAKNGYWGVKDDPDTEDAEKGSLEAMREMMRNAKDADGNAVFTEEEIASLSDGVAMTATQYAIWSFSNYMDDFEFLNVRYVNKNADNSATITWAGQLKDAPESEQASVALLFKLYDHLVNMAPTELEGTTADTIINKDNFVKDMSVTVLEKAKGHENNKDKDNTNDAYVVDLTFALVVEPAEGNGDELVVSVLDGNGNVLASGKIGDPKEGEGYLECVNGNYTFSGITMVEGESNFNITLEGVQNLQEGVYLYSSEIREGAGENGEDLSSQTMVGYAGGKRAVSVSMNLKFELDVDEKVVVKEHYWHSEKTTTHTPPTPRNPPEVPNNPPEEPEIFNLNRTDGVIEIPDEQVPLAAAPKTGDNSFLFIGLVLFAAMSLCAVNFGKKRQHETF